MRRTLTPEEGGAAKLGHRRGRDRQRFAQALLRRQEVRARRCTVGSLTALGIRRSGGGDGIVSSSGVVRVLVLVECEGGKDQWPQTRPA